MTTMTNSMSSKTNAFLRKNSPNPFKRNAEFKFGVDKEAVVTIEVYDNNGNKIRTLVDGIQLAGIYTIVWDGVNESGREAENGVYCIKMNTGEFTNSMQMIKMQY